MEDSRRSSHVDHSKKPWWWAQIHEVNSLERSFGSFAVGSNTDGEPDHPICCFGQIVPSLQIIWRGCDTYGVPTRFEFICNTSGGRSIWRKAWNTRSLRIVSNAFSMSNEIWRPPNRPWGLASSCRSRQSCRICWQCCEIRRRHSVLWGPKCRWLSAGFTWLRDQVQPVCKPVTGWCHLLCTTNSNQWQHGSDPQAP